MKNEIKHSFKVGQVVWFYSNKLMRSNSDSINETTITKVGNKYLSLDLWRIKIDKDTLREVTEYVVAGRIYLSLSDYELDKEHNKMSDRLKCIFGNIGKLPYTNEQLKKVLEILNEEI